MSNLWQKNHWTSNVELGIFIWQNEYIVGPTVRKFKAVILSTGGVESYLNSWNLILSMQWLIGGKVLRSGIVHDCARKTMQIQFVLKIVTNTIFTVLVEWKSAMPRLNYDLQIAVLSQLT